MTLTKYFGFGSLIIDLGVCEHSVCESVYLYIYMSVRAAYTLDFTVLVPIAITCDGETLTHHSQ